MRIFILTQEDSFYIPKLLGKFFALKPATCEVVGAALLRGEMRSGRIGGYWRMLGPWGFLRTGFAFAGYAAMDRFDRVLAFRNHYSVDGALRKLGVPRHHPSDVNEPAFLQLLRDLEVDLAVSIACPQIVRKELLALPPRGVINVHGALLPKYRGMLPSFWVLANGEKTTGVTVHYMNEKLDDGPIILQREMEILDTDTLHSLILRSKVGVGAELLAEAVALIEAGNVETRPNDAAQATSVRFPTAEAIRAFRERGRKVR